MVPGTAWKGSGWVWACSSVPVKNTAEETWAMAFYIVPACVRGDSIQRSRWSTKGDAATFTAELNGNSFTCTYIGDCIINLLNSVPLLCRKGFVALTESCFLRVSYYCSNNLLAPADSDQRELPDHVRHHFQSLTPAAPCHPHQDRLEQNPQLQDRQRNAERLMRKWGDLRNVCVQKTKCGPMPSRWFLSQCSVFSRAFKVNRFSSLRENCGTNSVVFVFCVSCHINFLLWLHLLTGHFN